MANLVVRNIDDAIVKSLKERAGKHGISAEAEHRNILQSALSIPLKRKFSEVLKAIPNVGEDADFIRQQDQASVNTNVFD